MNTRYISLVSSIVLLSISTSFSQQLLNLDFEKLSIEGPARPWGWAVYSYAQNTSFTCDTTTVLSGKHSLKIKHENESSSDRFELTHFIEPNQILGSTIQLEGWVKSLNFTGKAGINLKSAGTTGEGFGTLSEDESQLKITTEWTKVTAKITLDSMSHSLLATLFFKGSGTVWFDQLQLRVNDKIVTQVQAAPHFTREQQTWITNHSSTFNSVEPESTVDLSATDFSDLANFKSMVGEARLIALGESTHGTSEFFKLKHRLLQYAILELGVRVFILEDNQLIVERINQYVLHGEGEASTRGLFSVWNTQEMLQLITWLRQYNMAHPADMVEFVGMDVQNPKLAFSQLNDFLKVQDAKLHKQSSLLLKEVKEQWESAYYQSETVLNQWKQHVEANFQLILDHKKVWLAKANTQSDSSRIEWAIQNARLLQQFMSSTLSGGFEGRDKSMAENIEWILNQRKSGTKALIWAHDCHINRGDHPGESANYSFGNSMGSYLSQKFGNKYRAFGLSTYQGSCLGTVSYSDFTRTSFELYSSPKGSLDEAIHQVSMALKKPYLMLNLNSFKSTDTSLNWINVKRPVRYIGYVAEDYSYGGRYAIPFQFDGILFIDNTTATKKIN